MLTIQQNAHMLYKSKKYLRSIAQKILYYAQINSHISYGISVWGPMTKKASLMKILSVQKNCWRCIYATDKMNSYL